MKISEKLPKFRKFPEKFSPRIPGKIPENSGGISLEIQCYRAEITIFIIIKVMELQESFGKISEKISEMSKIPGRNFPGKFPGNSGGVFRINATLQSINLVFYV